MQPVLFDTSVYITALRRRDERVLQNRNLSRVALPVPLWLSAVVLEELYAGADAAGRKTVERLEREFGRSAGCWFRTLRTGRRQGRFCPR